MAIGTRGRFNIGRFGISGYVLSLIKAVQGAYEKKINISVQVPAELRTLQLSWEAWAWGVQLAVTL